MSDECKYKNWKELIVAFKEGKLKDWKIIMDNDQSYLEWAGDVGHLSDDALEVFMQEKGFEGEKLWEGGDGYKDIVDVLIACDIPAEWI